MKRNMINVTPLIPGYEKEIAADLLEMYRNGIIQSALFSCTLVPEGDPVSDKAARLAELFRIHRAALGKTEMPVGILFQATVGHGWVPQEQAPFQKFTFADGTIPYMFCPLDPEFQEYVRRAVRTLAAERPDFFMLDDDTRMFTFRGGCFCPLHMKACNERFHTEYTPLQLKQALLSDDDFAKEWDAFQQEGLLELARMIRAEFDAVNPAVRGMFCCCMGDIRHAPSMAETLAGEGNVPVLRINNPQYLYMHEKPGEVIDWMLKTAIQKAHVPADFEVLAETDTCCHNRYCTSAATIHALYTWSLLNGLSGGKLWITDLADYTPSAGKAYRAKLKKYSGFYDAVFAMAPVWQGVISPLHPYPDFNVEKYPEGRTNYQSWGTGCFGFLGLPYAYAEEPPEGTVTALSKSEVGFASDDELRRFLAGKVLVDGEGALALARRSFAGYIGAEVREWDLAMPTLEKVCDGTVMQRIPKTVRLLPQESAQVLSVLAHAPFRHAGESTDLAPGSIRFTNRLGGTVLTMAGALAPYGFASAPMLNFRRKEFLRRELDLKIWYDGDAPLTLHTFMDRGVQTVCAFNLGLDKLEQLELSGLPEKTKLEKLLPDGTWQPVPYEKNIVQTALDPMELLFLRESVKSFYDRFCQVAFATFSCFSLFFSVFLDGRKIFHLPSP